MSRLESHVQALLRSGFGPQQIARRLRIPITQVRTILETLDN